MFCANKAAKQLTAVRVTPVDIFKDAWGYIDLFLLCLKHVLFCRKPGDISIFFSFFVVRWADYGNQNRCFEVKPWCFPNPNQEGFSTALWQQRNIQGSVFNWTVVLGKRT